MSTNRNALTDDDSPAAREGQGRPAWPAVVGVVAIVVMGMNLLRLVIELIFKGMTILRMKDARFWQLPFALQFGRNIWDLGFVATLVLAALSLIRRRRTARFNLMIWSVFYIVYVVVSSGEQIGLCFDPTTAAVSGSFLFRMLTYKLMDLALPVFLLIWFCRDKIKEQVKGWADQSSGER